MASITIVGVGPGDPDLLTLKARDAIQSADYVAGFETVLKPVRRWIGGEEMPMRYRNQEDALERLAAHADAGKRCVVCGLGRPQLFGERAAGQGAPPRGCGTHPRHKFGAGGVRAAWACDGGIAVHHGCTRGTDTKPACANSLSIS